MTAGLPSRCQERGLGLGELGVHHQAGAADGAGIGGVAATVGDTGKGPDTRSRTLASTAVFSCIVTSGTAWPRTASETRTV